MIAHLRARAATAAVRQQSHVSSRWQYAHTWSSAFRRLRRRTAGRRNSEPDWPVRRKQTELNKMISAPARPELRPRAILVLFRNRADRPIRVQHVLRAAFLDRTSVVQGKSVD